MTAAADFGDIARDLRILIVTAADAAFFWLLRDLVRSLADGGYSRTLPVGVLDLGLDAEQREWLRCSGTTLVDPEWDIDFPGRETAPAFYRAMTARPYLPRHFPGYDIYFWIDSDVWVQDDSVFAYFLRPAAKGLLAVVPELDRSYWTMRKAPRYWGQNQKAFAWSYGVNAGYRLGRNPILNSGAFALRADAPHWRLWAEAHATALRRPGWRQKPARNNLSFINAEQTALNYAVFRDNAPATFLPAYCNWFCAKGTPMYDPGRNVLLEPHEPHRPLGLVHLAGPGKDRVWDLPTPSGGTVAMRLTYSALHPETEAAEPIGDS